MTLTDIVQKRSRRKIVVLIEGIALAPEKEKVAQLVQLFTHVFFWISPANRFNNLIWSFGGKLLCTHGKIRCPLQTSRYKQDIFMYPIAIMCNNFLHVQYFASHTPVELYLRNYRIREKIQKIFQHFISVSNSFQIAVHCFRTYEKWWLQFSSWFFLMCNKLAWIRACASLPTRVKVPESLHSYK